MMFRRKEFRGKLAIAITANFVNKRTTAEAVVDEIRYLVYDFRFSWNCVDMLLIYMILVILE